MLSSLRARLWLSYALLVGFVLAIIGLSLLLFMLRSPFSTREQLTRLRLLSALVVRRMGDPVAQSPRQQQEAAARAGELLEVRVILLDPAGEVVADSQPDQTEALPPRPWPVQRIGRAEGWFRAASGQTWLYHIRAAAGGYAVVVAGLQPRLKLQAIFDDDLWRPIWRAGLLALALALLLAYWIARWIARPLQRLAAGARAVAAGRYQTSALEGPREVQELGRAFNEMVARVQASQASQRDFVANVSHDLKTPLTSIQGFAQAILDGAADTPEALRQAAGVIFAEAGRMHRLVVDLLDLARLEAGTLPLNRTPVDLAGLLGSVIDRFAPQARQAGLALDLELAPLPPISGDVDRLAQVFNNLVDNALKYTPAGGRVLISARQQDGQVQVAIVDSGPGIPPEEQERIFERFYQLDKARPGGAGRGVGLGLPIARQIVQAHQGQILLKSHPGQGSTFMVKIPITRS